MLERFLAYIKKEKLIKNNDRALLAVSGGIDSMVMISLFMEAGLQIGVAHVNHHLRDKESDGDAVFVKEFCKINMLPFHLFDLDPALLIKGNLQENARNHRYIWLKKIASEFQYQYIATAHHLDDAMETFFINLMRGSGLSGLSGIASSTDNIIRPMLFATKSEIKKYSEKKSILFRDDSSNISDKYLRNRIRHHLLPAFYQADVRAEEGLLTSINYIRQSQQLMDYFVEKSSKDVLISSYDHQTIDLTIFPDGEVGVQWLFQIIRKNGYNMAQTEDILIHKNSSGKYFNTKDFEAIVDRNRLVIRKINTGNIPKLAVPVVFPFFLNWCNYEIKLDIIHSNIAIGDTLNTIYLNADHLTGELLLRSHEPGDIFKPAGMGGKSQKVKDFLINKKISVFDKEKLLVLTHEGEIIAIPGYRRSETVTIHEDSKRILKIMFKKNE